MRKSMTAVLVAGVLASGAASSADFGVYGTAGTIGFGGGIATNFNEHVGVRLGYTSYTYEVDDLEESDLTFDGDAKLGGAQALLDWYPMGGSFRISLGAVESAEVDVKARPIGGTFTFDDVEYSSEDIGNARARADFGSLAPYVGFGFGRALSTDGHFSFTGDIGVAFTGTPDVKLDVSCSAQAQIVCTQLTGDVAAEQAELQKDAEDYKYWPVLSIGVAYKF